MAEPAAVHGGARREEVTGRRRVAATTFWSGSNNYVAAWRDGRTPITSILLASRTSTSILPFGRTGENDGYRYSKADRRAEIRKNGGKKILAKERDGDVRQYEGIAPAGQNEGKPLIPNGARFFWDFMG